MGPPGLSGDPGLPGLPGVPGATGQNGEEGSPGDAGEHGEQVSLQSKNPDSISLVLFSLMFLRINRMFMLFTGPGRVFRCERVQRSKGRLQGGQFYR